VVSFFASVHDLFCLVINNMYYGLFFKYVKCILFTLFFIDYLFFYCYYLCIVNKNNKIIKSIKV